MKRQKNELEEEVNRKFSTAEVTFTEIIFAEVNSAAEFAIIHVSGCLSSLSPIHTELIDILSNVLGC